MKFFNFSFEDTRNDLPSVLGRASEMILPYMADDPRNVTSASELEQVDDATAGRGRKMLSGWAMESLGPAVTEGV